MKSLKRIVSAGIVALAITATGVTAFAATTYKTPAEIAANLTGKTVTEIAAQRATGKTYGTIAKEAGKLDEFKAENLKLKKDQINALVAAGKLTRAQADAKIKAIEANQATCDGSGTNRLGQGLGLGNGSGRGLGRGSGQGRGQCGTCVNTN